MGTRDGTEDFSLVLRAHLGIVGNTEGMLIQGNLNIVKQVSYEDVQEIVSWSKNHGLVELGGTCESL